MAGKPIYAALLAIQQGIVAPKDKPGYGYKYRTTDGILLAVKPLLKDAGVICTLSDETKVIGERYYVKATATLIDIATGDSITATGEANEPNKLANMAPPQITGTASTYARKRALEGLFLLDNEKDVDSQEVQDAIAETTQNAPQSTKKETKGKSTTKAQKTESEPSDKVWQQAFDKLNAEIKRLGYSKEELKMIAINVIGKETTREMTCEEVTKLAEYLAGEKGNG